MLLADTLPLPENRPADELLASTTMSPLVTAISLSPERVESAAAGWIEHQNSEIRGKHRPLFQAFRRPHAAAANCDDDRFRISKSVTTSLRVCEKAGSCITAILRCESGLVGPNH